MKRIIVALAMVSASVFNWRKFGVGLLPIALMSALVVVGSTPAQAIEGNDFPCVAAAAYTETVTEAYDETVVDHVAYDEVIPGTPGQWWNWSPNRDQGPFDGSPAFPADERGTWQGPHTEGGPDGIGTYQVGQGNGAWFHRNAGAPDTTVHHDAVTHVVHHEAVTVDHPALVCGGVIEVPAALPIKDECGIGNASWIYSGDTSNDFSWDLTDAGALSAHAHNGYVFANHETVIEFGLAPESNTKACSIPPVDVCQDVAGDQAIGTDCTPPKKVFVCKFVGKPGVNEVLKGGTNPISVSVNSIDPKFDGDPATLIGKDFADGQEFSRVIAVDAGGRAPTIADCLKVAPKTVVAEPPTVDSATCDNNGRLILPTTDNVTYVSTPAGTGPGKYTVTATAGSGFTLFGTSVFRITVAKQLPASECVEPIVESIVEPQILPAVLAGEGASLPNTGGISLWLLLLAGPMIAAGLLVAMRNRPVTHAFTGGYGPRYSLTSPPLAKAVEMVQTGFRKAVGRVAAAFGSLFGGRR